MFKHNMQTTTDPPEYPKDSMGLAPAVLARRDITKQFWCPNVDLEYDPWCNAENPRTILPKDINKAVAATKEEIPITPLVRSKCCVQLGSDIYYKFEFLNRTGSFHERGALYSLLKLTEDQKRKGVYTASNGNWAKALAYKGHQLSIPVTAVLPDRTTVDVVRTIREFGATVVLYGKNFAEAKTRAFVLMKENGSGTYINGYDHPHVIAAAGVVGLEILDQLPQTDAILIPVGGGGLIAGIASIVKHRKPEVLIYGIEPKPCCSFFKAIENERPYTTAYGESIAASLGVSKPGHNAFHTACSLIDKMILVDDNCISRAMLHLVEEEKIVAEGAGVIGLSPFFTRPNLIPELKDKTVVCVMTGSNIDMRAFPLVLERAKAIEGRLISVDISFRDIDMRLKMLGIISNLGVNINESHIKKSWISENDFDTTMTLCCETSDLQHACQLKRILTRLFPNRCQFTEEPFSPIPVCICQPGLLL